MGNFLGKLGLFLFLIFSGLWCVFYFGLLYDKITRPNFKNLDTDGFLGFGLLTGLFVVADIFILRFFLRIRKKNDT